MINNNKNFNRRLAGLVSAILIIVIGAVLFIANKETLMGSLPQSYLSFFRNQPKATNIQKVPFGRDMRGIGPIATKPTLKIIRTSAEKYFTVQRNAQGTFIGQSIGEYKFCASKTDINVNTVAFTTNGLGPSIKVNAILKTGRELEHLG